MKDEKIIGHVKNGESEITAEFRGKRERESSELKEMVLK